MLGSKKLSVRVGEIAHDLNNLLYVISGNINLLMEDVAENTPEHENLKEIEVAAKRSEKLVTEMLVLSKQEELVR